MRDAKSATQVQGTSRGATTQKVAAGRRSPGHGGPASLRGITPPSSDRPSRLHAATGGLIPGTGTIAGMNLALRLVLLVWVLGYLFVSCGPLLNGHLLLGGITLI